MTICITKFDIFNNRSMFIKFIFDRVTALVMLLLLSPILITVAILIRIKMPGGPVVFRQKRVGYKGKLFTMVKFRTMAVKHHGSPVSVSGDKRITPFGAKLRKYKIDELLELWNVLIGDMSFVGPRPDVPGYADKLQGNDRRVLDLRPGVTGPASMKFRHEEESLAHVRDLLFYKGEMILDNGKRISTIKEYNDMVIYPQKVRLNLYYMDHYSFIDDIRMIYCTVLGKKMKYHGEMI